ncbi:MAG: hypothetical protein E6K89_03390 [Thaumarchaeota archaeon]|nr:MAG: hypothetical protein E6K89_03390 [Nitrososphaerota archaeon]
MEKIRPGLRGVAERVARSINDTTLLGLGSGSTVAGLLEELSPLLAKKGVSVSGVPTSTQIEMVATKNGISIVPFMGSVDLVIDGADQVDSRGAPQGEGVDEQREEGRGNCRGREVRTQAVHGRREGSGRGGSFRAKER